MRYLVFTALACLTLIEIKSIECNVACVKEGFASGVFKKERCECVSEFGYHRMVKKRIVSPIYTEHVEEQSVQVGPVFRIDENWNFD